LFLAMAAGNENRRSDKVQIGGGWMAREGWGVTRRSADAHSFIRKNPMRVASFHRASQENAASG
jgi:hypothetical protein